MARGKGAKPATKPQETVVVEAEAEVSAAVLSFDNYVTILDEDVLNEWIAKLKKRQCLPSIPKRTVWITSALIWWGSRLRPNPGSRLYPGRA